MKFSIFIGEKNLYILHGHVFVMYPFSCIMVEMASESMGKTFMAKFKGTKIEKRLVYVRAWNSKDEAMYDPDPNIKSGL